MAKARPKSTKKKSAKKTEGSDILDAAIKEFVTEIESFAKSLPWVMPMVGVALNKANQDLNTFVDQYGQRGKEPNGDDFFAIPIDKLQKFERLQKSRRVALLAIYNVPVSFFVSLVSQYDAYLGNLLTKIFSKKTDLLNVSERVLTLSELMEFKDLSSAREFILEKEVESVIRQSHTEQFEWMENKFGLPLRKELEAWPRFIELTERRNLFVHCNGAVSTQYMTVCKRHGCSPQPKIHAGSRLHVSPEYFAESFHCLFEIGVKLGQVLWRKLFPNELLKADENLVDVCYDLLVSQEYKLAKVLLLFATSTLKKHSSEEYRRIFKINLAIAYNASGEKSACKILLAEEDWSACRDRLKIALAVLQNRFPDAADIMKRIGKTGEVRRVDYEEWPVFMEFRKTDIFQHTYSEVFGEEFSSPQKVAKPIDEKIAEQAVNNSCTESTKEKTPN